jgi:hypothetical protein
MAKADQKTDEEKALESFRRIRGALVTLLPGVELSAERRWTLPQPDGRTLADAGIAPRASAPGAG